MESILDKILYSESFGRWRCKDYHYILRGDIFLDLITDKGIILGEKSLGAVCLSKDNTEEDYDSCKNFIRTSIKDALEKCLLEEQEFPHVTGKHKIVEIKLSPSMNMVLMN